MMNERIEALMVTASNGSCYDGPCEAQLSGDEIKKFAELLIKECANIARQTETDDSDDYKSGRTWASLDILEHFGV